jgi:RNA polymerase sigma-70 factor, ECF subfamily
VTPDREVEAMLRGDESAFATVVERYAAPMLRVALLYVRDRGVAEEVVQEAWVSALRGLDRFEHRSSFKTWLFTILVHEARRRGVREARSMPFSALASRELASEDHPDAKQFFSADHPRWPGMWSTRVSTWNLPEERLLAAETQSRLLQSLSTLPEAQRLVFTLRDVEGFRAEEVCNLLELTDSNQRVLLHRARLKIRHELERYFEQGIR